MAENRGQTSPGPAEAEGPSQPTTKKKMTAEDLKQQTEETRAKFLKRKKEQDEARSTMQAIKEEVTQRQAVLAQMKENMARTPDKGRAKRGDESSEDVTVSPASSSAKKGKSSLNALKLLQKQQASRKSLSGNRDGDAEKNMDASSRVNLLKEQLEESRLLFHQHKKENEEVRAELELLRSQVSERDEVLMNLKAKMARHATDESAESEEPFADFHTQISHKDNKIIELNNKILEQERVMMDLRENLKEKDCVIQARTDAIKLMSEDLSRKGKTTLDALDETREEMRIMQNNFIEQEVKWKEEKQRLNEELQNALLQANQYEENSKRLEAVRFELSTKNAELQEKVVMFQTELLKNKEMSSENEQLAAAIASAEHNVQSISDFEQKLRQQNEDLDRHMDAITMLEKEKLDLMEGLAKKKQSLQEAHDEIHSLKAHGEELAQNKVSLELKFVEIEEQRDTAERHNEELKQHIQLLTEKLEYEKQPVIGIEQEKDALEEQLVTMRLAFEETITELNVQINTLKEQLDVQNQEMVQYKSLVDSKEEKNSEQMVENAAKLQQNEEEICKLRNIEEQFVQLNGEYEKLKMEMESKEQEVVQMTEQHAHTNNLIAQYEDRIAEFNSLSSQLQQQNMAMEQLQLELQEKNYLLQQTQTQMSDNVSRMLEYEARCNNLPVLEDQLQRQSEELSLQKSDLDSKDALLLELQEKLVESSSLIQQQSGQVEKIDILTQQLQQQNSEILRLNSDLESRDVAIGKINDELFGSISKIQQYESRIHELTSSVQTHDSAEARQLKSEIEAKDIELNQVKEQLDTSTSKTQQYEEKMKKLAANLKKRALHCKELEEHLEKNEAELASLKEKWQMEFSEKESSVIQQLSELEREVSDLQMKLSSSDEIIAGLRSAKTKAEDELSYTLQQLSTVGHENALTAESLSTLQIEIGNLKQESETQKANSDMYAKRCSELETLLADKDDLLKQMESSNSDSSNQLILEMKIQEGQAVIENLEADMMKAFEKVSKLEEDLEKAVIAREEALAKCEHALQERDEACHNQREANSAEELLRSHLESLGLENGYLKASIENLERNMSELTYQLAEKSQESENYKKICDEKTEQLRAVESEHEDICEQLKKMENITAELERFKTDHLDEAQKSKESIQWMEADINQLQEQVRQFEDERKNAVENHTHLCEVNESLNREVARLSAQVTQLTDEYNQTAEGLELSCAEVVSLSSQLEKLNDEKLELQTIVDSVQQRLASNEGAALFEERIAEQSNEITQLQNELSDTKQEINSIVVDFVPEEASGSVSEQLTSLRVKIRTMEESAVQQCHQMSEQMESIITAKDADLQSLWKSCQDKDAQIRALQNNIQSATENTEWLQSNLQYAQHNLCQVEAQLSEKNTQLEAETEKVNAVASDLDASTAKIMSLEAQIAEMNKESKPVPQTTWEEGQEGWGFDTDAEQQANVIEHLESEKRKLEEELRIMKVKSGKMLQKLKQMKEKNEQLSRDVTSVKDSGLDDALIDEMKLQVLTAGKEAAQLRDVISQLQLEKETFTARIDTLEAANEKFFEMKDKQDVALENLAKENKELRNSSESLVAVETLTTENKELQNTIRTLEWQLSSVREEIEAEVENTVSTLSQENGHLKEMLNSLQQQQQQAQEQTDLAPEIDVLRAHQQEMEKERSDMQNSIQELQQQLFSLQQNADEQQKLVEESLQQKGTTASENDYLQQQLSSLQENVNQLSAENSELKNGNHVIEQQLLATKQEQQAVMKENVDMKTSNEELHQQVASMHEYIQSQLQIVQENSDLKQQLASVEQQMSEGQQQVAQENANLKQQLTLAQEQLQSQNLLADENSGLKWHLTAIQEELSRITGEYANAQRVEEQLKLDLQEKLNSSSAEYEIQVAKLQQEIEEMQQRIQEASQQSEEIAELKVMNSNITEQLARTEEAAIQTSDFTSRIKELEHELSSVIEENRNLKSTSDFLQQQQMMQGQDTQQLHTDLATAMADNNELVQKVDSLSDDNTICRQQLNELQYQRTVVETELEEVRKQSEELLTEVEQLKLDLANKTAIENRLVELEASYDSMQKQYNSVYASWNDVEDKYENVKIELDAIKLERHSASMEHESDKEENSHRLKELQEDNERLTAELLAIQMEKNRTSGEDTFAKEELNHQIQQLHRENLRLLSELDGQQVERKESTTQSEDQTSVEQDVPLTAIAPLLLADVLEKLTKSDKQVLIINKMLESGHIHNQPREMDKLVTQLELLRNEAIANEHFIAGLNSELSLNLRTAPKQEDLVQLFAEKRSVVPLTDSMQVELDQVMRTLHDRDLRCEQLSLEVTRLLEERDTLQLKLSTSLRQNVTLQHKIASQSPMTSEPGGDLSPEAAALSQKLEELQELNYQLDIQLKAEKEERQKIMDQLLAKRTQESRRHTSLPSPNFQLVPEADRLLLETNYTLSRDAQSATTVFYNWLRGRSTPRVMHV